MNKKEFKNKIEHWKKGDYVLVYSFNYDRATKTNGEIIKYIENQDKEIERLNNIINSMNDYLVMNIANGGLDFMYRQGFRDSYERLQELKGSESNE